MGFHIVWLSICFGGFFVWFFFFTSDSWWGNKLHLCNNKNVIIVAAAAHDRPEVAASRVETHTQSSSVWCVCVCVLERSVLAGCQQLFIASLLFYPSSSMLPHLLAFFICLKRPPLPNLCALLYISHCIFPVVTSSVSSFTLSSHVSVCPSIL